MTSPARMADGGGDGDERAGAEQRFVAAKDALRSTAAGARAAN